ncbi:MAG TPA: hypothetical protein VK877_13030 [Pseudolabrys sp.]|nr:hypothetical protein [Pseudolabrys sp.]
MRANRTFLKTTLAMASLALGTMLMTSEIVLAQAPNPQRTSRIIKRPDWVRPGDQVNLVYDARTKTKDVVGKIHQNYTFGQVVGMTRADGAATRPANAIVHDHRKGSDFGKAGSNSYPPAGTNGGARPTSGNTVRDHRGEPHPYAVTQSTEYDHRPGANPNPRTVKSFRTATGMTVTVKSHQKPPCIGNACWFD